VWARKAPEGWHIEHLRIVLLALPQDSGVWPSWPPHFDSTTPNCSADCVWADSIVAQDARVDGAKAHIETALLSGGVAGWSRDAQFVAGWAKSSRVRVAASGWARDPVTRDTLVMIIKSARVAGVIRRD